MHPSKFQTLQPIELEKAIQIALLYRNNEKKAQESGLYNFKYKDGIMLFEPINGDPYVVNVKYGQTAKYIFESEPGSGTDKLRKRIAASLFFESITKKDNVPYYLESSDVPNGLKLDDLPIMVGKYQISQNSKPFKSMKNPISGHEWSEPTGMASNCSVRGSLALSDNYRSVKGAVDYIAYLERDPYIPELTEREIAYIEQADDSINRAQRSRPSM